MKQDLVGTDKHWTIKRRCWRHNLDCHKDLTPWLWCMNFMRQQVSMCVTQREAIPEDRILMAEYMSYQAEIAAKKLQCRENQWHAFCPINISKNFKHISLAKNLMFNVHNKTLDPNLHMYHTSEQLGMLKLKKALAFLQIQVLVPSERKTIHLYEARYLALLEESLFKKDKLFVHFVLEPIVIDDLSSEPSFAARHACLVLIENVEQLDVGALVSIRGITRVQISDPYLKGEVVPFHDNSPDSVTNLSSKVSEAPRDEKLQTNAANSLMWSEQEPSINCDDTFVPSLAERISFASLQPISGKFSTRSTQSELQALQRERLNAMDSRDTLLRLDMSLEFAKKNISIIAAKLAIQSLEI
ncbi:hypothetical protein RJ641_029876, partial [Dillenia turbinata]